MSIYLGNDLHARPTRGAGWILRVDLGMESGELAESTGTCTYALCALYSGLAASIQADIRHTVTTYGVHCIHVMHIGAMANKCVLCETKP